MWFYVSMTSLVNITNGFIDIYAPLLVNEVVCKLMPRPS